MDRLRMAKSDSRVNSLRKAGLLRHADRNDISAPLVTVAIVRSRGYEVADQAALRGLV
jgi:hypothetical protein